MSWIQTHTGRKFYPESMSAEQVSVFDIAHALSHVCRFAGHVPYHYSVAQHSVYVSQLLEHQGMDAREQLRGLLHDATEAYLVDMPQPIKRMEIMRGYCELEDRLEAIIAKAFGLKKLCTLEVKRADLLLLAAEARDLLGDPQDWKSLEGVIAPQTIRIARWAPEYAKDAFLERFRALAKAELL